MTVDERGARSIIAPMNHAERPPPPRRLSLLALAATTFFIVSGGPYGLEEIIQGHGYARAIALLVVVPIVWSLPVTAMVGELASALPEEGGYYAWVRRALGPFWGVQEAWLSLAYGLFDMAIYPTLFVAYAGEVFPSLRDTSFCGRGWWCGVGVVAACAMWNLRGGRAVGDGSEKLGAILLMPFALLALCAIARAVTSGLAPARQAFAMPAPATNGSAFVGGLLLCMWNYMGWDNASTVANEVENPQRNYPRAMLGTLGVVAFVYVASVLAATLTAMPLDEWQTGAWVRVGVALGGAKLGKGLGVLVVAGGAVSALGMFNALLFSASRLPVALANDGWLPRILARKSERTGAPTVAIVASAVAYGACLTLGLRRLVEIDVALYGTALALEFVALVALRIREPNLARPFRVPGGTIAAALLGVPPTLMLLTALWFGRHEEGAFGLTGLQLSIALMLVGPVLYALRRPVATAAEPAR